MGIAASCIAAVTEDDVRDMLAHPKKCDKLLNLLHKMQYSESEQVVRAGFDALLAL